MKVRTRSLSRYLADVSESSDLRRGVPLPWGAQVVAGGANFSFFSRHATRVVLELFSRPSDTIAKQVIEFDPLRNRTGDMWHVWVKGVKAGQLYSYRVDGPDSPQEGQRFNVRRRLLDPLAPAITLLDPWDYSGAMPKCILAHDHFHWQEDRPPRHPWARTVIYETHVRGLSIHHSSGVQCPGTYRGLIEKIPYLKDLGITAVELMPVQEFNDTRITGKDPVTGASLRNYWGYDPVSFFATKGSYSSAGSSGQQILEFKEMVRQLHAAQIEVILDVVFNHTAEANEHGPTICWRGIDNSIFYALAPDKRLYVDDAGTGNTINANHPVVREMILGALRYWVAEMHVDGFRFDLASILGRDRGGRLLTNAPLLDLIAEDPILRDAKLIAEAWDAAGAYQVGSFSRRRWAEWNGQFRDDVRRFWRGDDAMLGKFASRICGSADIYGGSGKGPECSINYITCHDGFTLSDLVSYRDKHNLPNGDDNRDGTNDNYSANHGAEGDTSDSGIESLRKRQIRNFLLTLFISRGVPMLLGGDEMRRTQAGNNNAYCQDNEISWYDWELLTRHRDIHRFTRQMIAFRRAHPVLAAPRFYETDDIHWFAAGGRSPNWFDRRARQLACLIHESSDASICLLFNAAPESVNFQPPATFAQWNWRLAIDTGEDTPAQSGGESAPSLVDATRPLSLLSQSSAIYLVTNEH